IQGLRDEEQQFSAPMQAMELKVAHAQASYALRSRAPDGRANR
ncbi:MAG: hypothetical protein QOI92_2098, partial [Chloroflexota bacterium]|nr:hypothetical protein [Chloroflexota bacterium]